MLDSPPECVLRGKESGNWIVAQTVKPPLVFPPQGLITWLANIIPSRCITDSSVITLGGAMCDNKEFSASSFALMAAEFISTLR